MKSKIIGPKNFPWKKACNFAYDWLKKDPREIKILFEQNRNLGDTLHLTPVIRHYRLKYPDAAMAFLVGNIYLDAHEYNPDLDVVVGVPTLNPHNRILLRREIIKYSGLKHIISPSIFPYSAVWKELTWSTPNIADQYFLNAGIRGKLLGGKKLEVKITKADQKWANEFIRVRKLDRRKVCVLEYNSYSGQPIWRAPKFAEFVKHARKYGIVCISVAGKKESPINGTLDCTGITWRKTVALMNCVDSFIGIGSGLTMLAAAAEKQPKILEIGIGESINMSGCGYANSIKITNPDPKIVADHLWHKVLNK